jgi:CHAT domain-containing protein
MFVADQRPDATVTTCSPAESAGTSPLQPHEFLAPAETQDINCRSSSEADGMLGHTLFSSLLPPTMLHPTSQPRRIGIPQPRAFGEISLRSLPVLVLIGVVCAITATAVAGTRSREAPRGLLRELAREMHLAPSLTPRLSISPDNRRCTPDAGSRPGCAPSATAPRRSDRIAGIAARASHAIRERDDPDALHAAALIDLLYESGAGKSLQRTISSLQTAARLAEQPAPALADVAAAYLVRAERARMPRDLLAAIEAAEEALQREPANHAALFNLALAMERFGLIEEAGDGWREYLRSDSTSGWAHQAQRHLTELLAMPTEPAAPAADAPLSAYAAYAAAEPQRARELGWCRILGAWADAELAGDAMGAAEHLRRAEMLGMTLEKRAGGDASLADGVRAIRAQPTRRYREGLARAQHEFSEGCLDQGRVDFPSAALRFNAAAVAAQASPPLRSWARMMYGGMIFRQGDMVTGEAVLRQVCATTDLVRHPGLAASAQLALSALLIRADRYEAGLQQARQAAAISLEAGEIENHGVALDNISIAYFHMRDMDRGYRYAQQALRHLRPYRKSFRLHNMLGFAGQTVADDGFPNAALRMLNEGVRVAERTGIPVFAAEAHLIRARLAAQAGASTLARQDIAAGEAAIARLTTPRSRAWHTARRRMAEAALSLASTPQAAAEEFDSAAVFFTGIQAPLVAFPAIVGSAQAWLAANDATQATARLERALQILENRRDSVHMEPRRAAIFDAARAVVDRVTMLKLASGSAAEGLAYMDRGRASLAPVGRPDTRDWEVAAPPGETALEYAVVGDTLLVWVVTGREVELFRTEMDTARLFRSMVRLQRQLEEATSEAELRPGLVELYEQLVRPVERWLGGAETPLVVVADGVLGTVPFSALYDTRRMRYLVEDHPIRFAASLLEAWRRAPHSNAAPDVLFVADPAFAPSTGFPRLPSAAEEVREIAAGYRRAQTLSDAAATPGALRAALGRSSVMHYAGHAVFDDERPERSYLLLAPEPGAATLQAAEIAQLDLNHLSLVVLAACQTVRTGPGRAAGFSGLAGAFLAAGAGGALGSLWEVDDRLTRPLMREFHREYRASGSGPAALRRAQLRLLRSSDPVLRSPRVWSGFRYVGS